MRTHLTIRPDGTCHVQRRFRHLEGVTKVTQTVVIDPMNPAATAATITQALEAVAAEQVAKVSAQVKAE